MQKKNSPKIINLAQSLKVVTCATVLIFWQSSVCAPNASAEKINAETLQAQAEKIAEKIAEKNTLLIYSREGEVREIKVELAITADQQQKGLMFRTKLEKNHGMLFVHKKPHVVRMWMKNTFIPLDMIFVSQNGTVVKIVEQAKPMSTRVISSSVKVIAVLELAGGSAKRLGISLGDKVKYPES